MAPLVVRELYEGFHMARRTLPAPAGKVLARKFSANLFKRRSRPIGLDLAPHPPAVPRDRLDLRGHSVESGFFGHSIDAEGVAPRPRPRNRMRRLSIDRL